MDIHAPSTTVDQTAVTQERELRQVLSVHGRRKRGGDHARPHSCTPNNQSRWPRACKEHVLSTRQKWAKVRQSARGVLITTSPGLSLFNFNQREIRKCQIIALPTSDGGSIALAISRKFTAIRRASSHVEELPWPDVCRARPQTELRSVEKAKRRGTSTFYVSVTPTCSAEGSISLSSFLRAASNRGGNSSVVHA
jgi:hypothetical protein